jgi:hypothetical protein
VIGEPSALRDKKPNEHAQVFGPRDDLFDTD